MIKVLKWKVDKSKSFMIGDRSKDRLRKKANSIFNMQNKTLESNN